MQKSGLSDVTVEILAGTRHETLNEINRDQSMDSFAAWLDSRIADP
jgi:alpha-beta hydrolase superfamily lysophospholipase